MLYAFGFERVGVLFSDMYVVIPDPPPGQEGAERGVRLEVRLLERGELKGNMFSSRPVEVGQPVWRADLLEAVQGDGEEGMGRRVGGGGPPGSLDRAHHHPNFRGWNPGRRAFDPELTADPVQFVGQRLADLEGLLERAGIAPDEATAADAESLRACLPEIMDTVGRLLDRVQRGELAGAPGDGPVASARVGWL
ncbi:MAG TPA: hypothetical protein VGJ50_27530 [Streptosporangiaceae bacterium]